MNEFTNTFSYFTSKAFIVSLIAIVITFALLRLIKKYLIKKVAYTTKAEQHQNTFIGVIFNLLQYFVVIVCAIIVLQQHGVNVTSIIAGLGIIATLVGLALQDTMKDVICGVNIYSNNFYKVGDLVKYNNETCDVKYFSARITKFQSLTTGNTYTVCNSTISTIEKIKDVTMINIMFDFEDDKKKIEKVFAEAYEAIKDEKYLKDYEYYGIVNIDTKGIVYCANIVSPGHKVFPIKAKYLDAIYEGCVKYKVTPAFDMLIKEKD